MRDAVRRIRYTRQLDRQREELAYLKIWQGVFLVTDISLLGWLISGSADATESTIALARIGATVLTFAVAHLHRNIERHIELIGSL